MNPVKLTLVARRVEDKWEAAFVSNGKLLRAFSEKDLFKVISTHLMVYLKSDRPNETEVQLELSIQEPTNVEQPADN